MTFIHSNRINGMNHKRYARTKRCNVKALFSHHQIFYFCLLDWVVLVLQRDCVYSTSNRMQIHIPNSCMNNSHGFSMNTCVSKLISKTSKQKGDDDDNNNNNKKSNPFHLSFQNNQMFEEILICTLRTITIMWHMYLSPRWKQWSVNAQSNDRFEWCMSLFVVTVDVNEHKILELCLPS